MRCSTEPHDSGVYEAKAKKPLKTILQTTQLSFSKIKQKHIGNMMYQISKMYPSCLWFLLLNQGHQLGLMLLNMLLHTFWYRWLQGWETLTTISSSVLLSGRTVHLPPNNNIRIGRINCVRIIFLGLQYAPLPALLFFLGWYACAVGKTNNCLPLEMEVTPDKWYDTEYRLPPKEYISESMHL